MNDTVKVGIIGCGKIADAHAAAIALIPDAKIVAACDQEILMAKQFAERFGILRYCQDVKDLFEANKPDVVHITAPPHTHFDLGRSSLKAGCHVYIEKPFTLNSSEATELLCLAEKTQLKITVGTDEQFSHVAETMRALIERGYLGGAPVHMEASYGYDLGDIRYAQAFLDNKDHWLRQLPGQLLHNIISHGIARIAEYLHDGPIQVVTHGSTSNFLKKLGEKQLVDELRTIIIDSQGTTAYFTFTTQMRPILKEFRVFGPKNGLVLNQDHHTLLRLRGKDYKSYLNNLIPLNDFAKQYRRNMLNNIRLFWKQDFRPKSGLKRLIELFYQSFTNQQPLPISYREILDTVKIMDDIFAQLATQATHG